MFVVRNLSWLCVEPLSYCLQHGFRNCFEHTVWLGSDVCDVPLFEVSISSVEPRETCSVTNIRTPVDSRMGTEFIITLIFHI